MTELDRQRLVELLANTPSPTRRERRTRATLSYSIALGFILLVFTSVSAYARGFPRSVLLSLSVGFGLCALAASITLAVFARGGSPLGRSSTTLGAITLFAPLAVLSWLSLWEPSIPAPHIPVGWRCLALTLVLGVALLSALAVAKRGSDPVHPNWLGAALGVIAGTWSAVLVAVWCPLFDFSHALLGHVAPILVLSAGGALLASRSLRFAPSWPRGRRPGSGRHSYV